MRQELEFVSADGRALLSTYTAADVPPGLRSGADLHRYDAFVEAVLPGLRKRLPSLETAVVHFSVLQRCVADALLRAVEEAWAPGCGAGGGAGGGGGGSTSTSTSTSSKSNDNSNNDDSGSESGGCNDFSAGDDRVPFWQVVRALSLGSADPAPSGLGGRKGRGPGSPAPPLTPPSPPPSPHSAAAALAARRGLAVSEYELYFAFAWARYRDRVQPRPLAFAVARDWAAWLPPADSDGRLDEEGRSGAGGCGIVNDGGDNAARASTAVAAARSRVAYVVSHSPLRLDGSLTPAQLAQREGIVNAAHAGAGRHTTVDDAGASLALGAAKPTAATGAAAAPVAGGSARAAAALGVLSQRGLFDQFL